MNVTNQENNKNTWRHESGFIWSMIGSAVGFANILGFSSKAYFHGGGAFLVPFLVAIVVLGLPLLFLEGIIGQKFSLPLVSACGRIYGTIGKFFGWLAILAVLTIGGFYTVLTGWSVAYTYFSATNSIPDNTAFFFKYTFLKDSGSLTNFGGIAGFVVLFTLVVALFSWFVLVRNIQSGLEWTCSIFLPMLGIIVALFAVSVCFLPGAFEGFKYFLMPDFTKLKNPRIWLDSFGHLFFSLSLGLGIVTGYSRHADERINVARSMVFVIIGDLLISLISGFAIFGCVGYMSNLLKVPFTTLVRPDSNFEMGFVIFPMILKTFGPLFVRIVGSLFFFSVFIAGVTGVFSIIESIGGNIEIEFGKTRSRAITITVLIMTACSLFFCMGNGQHIVGALEPMVTGFNSLISGIAEIIIFMFGAKIIKDHAIWFVGANGERGLSYYLLRYINIPILTLIFIAAIINEYYTGFGYPEFVRWGWFAMACVSAGLLAMLGKKSVAS